MSTMQLTPIWLIQAGDMSTDLVSPAIKTVWEDNVGIQATWTGTPTGTFTTQISMDPDNLGWVTVPSTPTPVQPAGTAATGWFEINQTTAAWVRLVYTRVSGTGTLKAKIALKSV